MQNIFLEQIEKFLKQSIEKNVKWKSIRLLGGEPTLHPEIEKIVQILLEYKEKYSKECNITVVSNGSGEFVNSILDRLKNKYTIEIQNSNKISDIQVGFSPVNQAPIDMEEYKLLNGWSYDKKRGSVRYDRIPVGIRKIVELDCPQDYMQFVPDGLENGFTSADFANAAHIDRQTAASVLAMLNYMEQVKRVGKTGNAYIYDIEEHY